MFRVSGTTSKPVSRKSTAPIADASTTMSAISCTPDDADGVSRGSQTRPHTLPDDVLDRHGLTCPAQGIFQNDHQFTLKRAALSLRPSPQRVGHPIGYVLDRQIHRHGRLHCGTISAPHRFELNTPIRSPGIHDPWQRPRRFDTMRHSAYDPSMTARRARPWRMAPHDRCSNRA